MSNQIKHFSLGLASAIALGLLGCGSPSDTRTQVGQGPDPGPIVTPPAGPLPEPKVQYNFFRPKTEDELRGAVCRVRVGGQGDDLGNDETQYAYLPVANYGYLIARTRPDFSQAQFDKYGLEVVSSFAANGARYFYLHKDSDLVATMKKVGKLSGVMYIEPDVMNYATAGFEYKPGDAYVNNERQFGVLTTMAKKAWETYGFGPNRPIVADFDTGVRWSHPDLKDVVTNAFSWYGTNGSSLLDNAGALSPLNDPSPVDRMVTDPTVAQGSDGQGHGTHTAGTIAAVGNNTIGVAGMCWNVKLVSYKVLNNSGSGGSWAVYGSFWHLAKWKNEKVDEDGKPSETGTPRYPHTIPVNLSLGGGTLGQFNADMVEMALENDIVLCASSGNDDAGFASWPGSLAGVIRVGAVNNMDRRVYFSNWGPDMSVMAPGNDIYSTANDGSYELMGGTSMACPHVTGLVGYMLTFNPDLKPDQIKTYLEKNADRINGQKEFDIHYGYGRINAYRTIGAVIDDMDANRAPASNYVMTPVKITVKDSSGSPVNNALVYLYNCNEDGTITNYANMSITGMSFVDVRDDKTLPPEEGVARFNMLRPGHYKVTATYSLYDYKADDYIDSVASSPTFKVWPGDTVAPMTLTLDTKQTLAMQTMATANFARASADVMMQIFDSPTAAAFETVDQRSTPQEDFVTAMLPPGTYYVRIYPYSSTRGEYALWVGTKTMTSFAAVGTAAAPGPNGIASTNAADRATAQVLELNGNKLVYGDLTNATGHYYKFVIPEPAP